jgi:hypothetical protein
LARCNSKTLQDKIQKACLYIEEYFLTLQQKYHDPNTIDVTWNPRNLVLRFGPGVYTGILRRNAMIRYKGGQSMVNCYERVKQQPEIHAAAGLFTAEECLGLVPVELREKIAALRLPRFVWDPTMKAKLHQSIAQLVIEAYTNCAYKTLTTNVLELVVAVPSSTVEQIMTMPTVQNNAEYAVRNV